MVMENDAGLGKVISGKRVANTLQPKIFPFFKKGARPN